MAATPRTTPSQKWIYILQAKFAIVWICSARQWLQKRAQAKYVTTAFNFNWNTKSLALVLRVPWITQNLATLFVVLQKQMYKEMHKDL